MIKWQILVVGQSPERSKRSVPRYSGRDRGSEASQPSIHYFTSLRVCGSTSVRVTLRLRVCKLLYDYELLYNYKLLFTL
jgi:hypothetical protein